MSELAARGRFITFEGGEGAGKSTQIQRLAEYLGAMAIACRVTREPGGTPGAEAIRRLLLEERQPFDPLAESLLFAAARADHVRRFIVPAIAAGEWVLCDRFADSTRAYQGAGRVQSPEVIDTLESLAVGASRPDLTVVLDLDPVVGLARAGARRGLASGADRFEGEALAFHQRVRAAFRAIAQGEPGRCMLVDAEASVDAVAAEIAGRIAANGWLQPRKGPAA